MTIFEIARSLCRAVVACSAAVVITSASASDTAPLPAYSEVVAKPKAYIGRTVEFVGRQMSGESAIDGSGKIVSQTMTFCRLDAAQKIVFTEPFIVDGKWVNTPAAEVANRTPGDPFIRIVRGTFVRMGEASVRGGGTTKVYPAPVLRNVTFDVVPKP